MRQLQITPWKPCTETLVSRSRNQNWATRTASVEPKGPRLQYQNWDWTEKSAPKLLFSSHWYTHLQSIILPHIAWELTCLTWLPYRGSQLWQTRFTLQIRWRRAQQKMGGATCKMAANQCDSRSPLVRIVLWNIETTPIFLMRESVATVLSFVVLILPANTGWTWHRNDKTPCYNITHTRKKNYMLPLFLVATLICMLILGPPWPMGYKLSYNHTYFK